ncbi:MAG: hypothetical protein M0Z44_08030 [Gammaproteobacteria bacterium]|nr:hypothetical protein [Gammaproteobacteria bacterium]
MICTAGVDVRAGSSVGPATPLYERVPTRDAGTGERLADFMMLFPGLRERPGGQRGVRARLIKGVLVRFPEVVFADLNLRLNLLWVSVRTRPGVILDIATCLKLYMPEALLVAPKYVY